MEIKVTFMADVDEKDFSSVSKAFDKVGADVIGADFDELKNIGCFKVTKTAEEIKNFGKSTASDISHAINTNNMGFMQNMLDYFKTDHRFLQGQEMRAILTFIKMFSQVGTDERNEFEVNLMKKIVRYVEEDLDYGEIRSKF